MRAILATGTIDERSHPEPTPPLVCRAILQREPPSLWLRLQPSGFPRRILLFLLLVQTFVEPDDPPTSDQDGDDRHPNRKQDKTTSQLVQRLLVAEEEVRSEPVAGGTEGVGDGDQSGFLRMSRALCENTL